MPNLTIKPVAAAGNKLILQDQAGGAVLTTADSGATLGNSTQDNITRVGTVTSGTLGSGLTGTPSISLDNATAPAFLVQAQAMSNLANGAYTDVQYVTVIKNVGGGSFGSYTYTAPTSGLYYISASGHYSGFPNNVTDFRMNIVTSNRTYEMRYAKFINAEHPTNYTGTFRNSALADLDANDTCKIQVYQSGGSNAGDLESHHSYFSGFLVSKY